MVLASIRGVSVDALGTIVQVRGGSVGQQYALVIRRFLQQREPQLFATSSSSSCGASLSSNFPGTLQAALDKFIAAEMLDSSFRVAFKQSVSEFSSIGCVGRPRTAEDDERFWTTLVLPRTLDGPLRAVDEALAAQRSSQGHGTQPRLQDGERCALYAALYRHFGSAEAWELLPGAAHALGQMHHQGVKLCCVTNNDRRMASVLSELAERDCALGGPEQTGLRQVAACVVSALDVSNLKPDPEGIKIAMARLKLRPDQWLHIGDEAADEEAARQAQCRFVRVSDTRGMHWSDVAAHMP